MHMTFSKVTMCVNSGYKFSFPKHVETGFLRISFHVETALRGFRGCLDTGWPPGPRGRRKFFYTWALRGEEPQESEGAQGGERQGLEGQSGQTAHSPALPEGISELFKRRGNQGGEPRGGAPSFLESSIAGCLSCLGRSAEVWCMKHLAQRTVWIHGFFPAVFWILMLLIPFL